MKNIVLVILAVISLSSCKQVMDYGTDCSMRDRYCNIPLYPCNFKQVFNRASIPSWIDYYMDYRESSDLQTPTECMQSGYGDCEEWALLYLNIRYMRFQEKGELCLVQSGRTVEAGGQSCNHAVVRYGSTLIDPMNGNEVNYEVCYSYAFDDIFN